MTADEEAAQVRSELSVAIGRMKRFTIMRLGARLSYAITADEADAALAANDDLSIAFAGLASRHRFDWIRNPWLLFKR